MDMVVDTVIENGRICHGDARGDGRTIKRDGGRDACLWGPNLRKLCARFVNKILMDTVMDMLISYNNYEQ